MVSYCTVLDIKYICAPLIYFVDSYLTLTHFICIILYNSGAPAAGKGTQCAFIKEKFGVVHLSTGDMLRAAVAAETDVGIQAKDFMDAGKLVPDEVMIGIVSVYYLLLRNATSILCVQS